MEVKIILFKLLISVLCFSSMSCQSFQPNPYFHKFWPLYRSIRNIFLELLGTNSAGPKNLDLIKQFGKMQSEVLPDVPFPCNVTGFRSSRRPSSVHKLRPGDIDIVGAIGDSLTAGNGLVATNPLQVLVENRGLAGTIGGQGTWRQYLTLPNILKEFNTNLFGYSLGDSSSYDKTSQFNSAEAGALSSELPYMTKILIKRIKNDKRVDLKKDWKLISIMIGSNDFCLDICYQNLTEAIESHRKDMIEVLRLLRDNLPRTYVNYVLPPTFKGIMETKNTPEHCQLIRRLECYCLFSDQFIDKRDEYLKFMRLWQDTDEEISHMSEFHTNDFEVVFQPCVAHAEVPMLSPEQTDFSYMSADCFHMSQKYMAGAANTLWNSMLQKEGSKNYLPTPIFEPFLCPTEESPYIITTKNSQ